MNIKFSCPFCTMCPKGGIDPAARVHTVAANHRPAEGKDTIPAHFGGEIAISTLSCLIDFMDFKT